MLRAGPSSVPRVRHGGRDAKLGKCSAASRYLYCIADNKPFIPAGAAGGRAGGLSSIHRSLAIQKVFRQEDQPYGIRNTGQVVG
jgi:hypothetical protein